MATLVLDTFSGAAGPLRDHIADSGAGWTTSGWQGDDLVTNGAGALQFNLYDTASFASTYSPAKVDSSIEVVISIGEITAGTLPTQHRYDQLVIELWDWFDYSVEISNGAGANDLGDLPTLYFAHRNSNVSFNVTANSSVTLRWDIVGTVVTLFKDNEQVLVSSDALRSSGPNDFGGYFDRYAYAGLPSVPPMLRLDRIHLYDASTPPPAEPVAFWESFQRSYEVP